MANFHLKWTSILEIRVVWAIVFSIEIPSNYFNMINNDTLRDIAVWLLLSCSINASICLNTSSWIFIFVAINTTNDFVYTDVSVDIEEKRMMVRRLVRYFRKSPRISRYRVIEAVTNWINWVSYRRIHFLWVGDVNESHSDWRVSLIRLDHPLGRIARTCFAYI